MEKSHDLEAVLSELSVLPADIDRSIVSIARAQRASVRTNRACPDSRVDAACGSGSADQSAASVPSELVSPLAAPFAGSCGLSPWICCTESTLVREYYRSRDSIRSYTRTTLLSFDVHDLVAAQALQLTRRLRDSRAQPGSTSAAD